MMPIDERDYWAPIEPRDALYTWVVFDGVPHIPSIDDGAMTECGISLLIRAVESFDGPVIDASCPVCRAILGI